MSEASGSKRTRRSIVQHHVVVTTFYAVKGGVGCTTTAAAAAVQAAAAGDRVALVSTAPHDDLRGVLGETGENLAIVDCPEFGADDVAALGAVGFTVVVIDAGTNSPPDVTSVRLLVTTVCYLALRRAIDERPDGMVLVVDHARSLGRDDVDALRIGEIVAEIPVETAISRTVDAGLLGSRVPRVMAGPVQRICARSGFALPVMA